MWPMKSCIFKKVFDIMLQQITHGAIHVDKKKNIV
jgi:hypothetical protein